MQPRVGSWRAITLGWLGLLLLGGCSATPTYRADQAASAIRDICATEYHLQVSSRQVGPTTIVVHLHHPDILDRFGSRVELAPSANQVLGNVLEAIHRVTLSSEPQMDFYVVLVSDPSVPGAYLTLIRYLDDVKRVYANIIPPAEFFSRTILELKLTNAKDVTFEQIAFRELTLEEFLSWQLAQRIQTRLADQVTNIEGQLIAQVGPCAGEFHDGEFTFSLNVTPPPGLQLDDKFLPKIFEEATTEIAQVLSGYRFERFEAIRLIHPLTGRYLTLPKAQLELFR